MSEPVAWVKASDVGNCDHSMIAYTHQPPARSLGLGIKAGAFIPLYPADAIERKDAAIAELLAALKEARRWIGDGPCADGLSAEYWTQEYRDAVSMVDAAIAKAES